MYRCFGCVVVFAAGILVSSLCEGQDVNDSNVMQKDTEHVAVNQKREPPIVIWHWHQIRDDMETLKMAISSGLITHVSIGGTQNWRDKDHRNNAKVKEAFRIVKEAGLKAGWDRTFWPINDTYDVTLEDIFDPNYYIQEIKTIREEAKYFGADYTSFNMEPHGKAPMQVQIRD